MIGLWIGMSYMLIGIGCACFYYAGYLKGQQAERYKQEHWLRKWVEFQRGEHND